VKILQQLLNIQKLTKLLQQAKNYIVPGLE